MNKDILELGSMLIILVFIISGVQWFLVRYIHWSIALVATGFISMVVSVIYVSLFNASPNGAGNGLDISKFITPALVIFGALICGLALICFLTQNQLPKKAFIVPLSLILAFLMVRNVYQYVDGIALYTSLFSNCKIEVLNETGTKSPVEEISFYSNSSSIIKSVYLNSNENYNPSLPRFASKIIFRCNGSKTNTFFEKEFPFDYSLCKETEGKRLGYCFWLREKIILPIKILLLPNNKVDLYLGGNLVKQYQINQKK